MKLRFISAILILSFSFANSQEVQWASKVLEFSSQYSEYQYSATQVLGKPDVLPGFGDNPNAWLPSRPDRISFIKVGFERPMKVQQIAIGESFNPSALYQVFLYDQNDSEYLLNTFMPRQLSTEGRILNIYISEPAYAVSAVKIVLDGSKVRGFPGIDAIGISGTTIPIVAIKDVAFRRNPDREYQQLLLGAEEGVSDFRPVFYKKQNMLFFTRSISPRNVGGSEDIGDVWRSALNPSSTEFSETISMGNVINNKGYNTIHDIYTVNDHTMFLLGNVSGTDKVTTNIAVAHETDNGWGDIEGFKIKNARIGSFDADYTITSMDSVLIVSTLRYDTEGGRDLYIMRQDKNGRWSEPENLGGNINTTMDEYSPFYSESERSLYFSSPGYPGFGGKDIFRVTRLDESWSNWSTPENIGMDINSDMDEVYFYFDDSDDYAYFARLKTDSTFGIMRVERPVFLDKTPLVTIRGNVQNKETQKPINSNISIMILPEEGNFGMTLSDQTTGNYEIRVPSGYAYKLMSEKEEYESFETTLTLENKGNEYIYDLDIDMGLIISEPEVIIAESNEVTEEPEVSEDVIMINDGILSIAINFAFDSDVIMENSFAHLDEIINLLGSSPINIILAGHCDVTGPEDYNLILSERRAKSVYKYFVEKGIDPDKISTIGYGSSRPVASNDTKEGRKKNRRVEFIRADQMDLYNEKYDQ